jgi:carbon-monoxide dehydrogenase medium subunit
VQDFDYHAPASIEAALALLREGGARVLAGGTDLVPQLREGRRTARRIVDVKRIEELTAISPMTGGGVRIGAAVSATSIARHPALAAYPGLVRAARMIGSVQIQSRASLGGNICNAAPSADAVPVLICLGATAVIAGPDGPTRLPVGDLFAGPGRCAIAPDKLLTAIELPALPSRSAAFYLRFTPRREMDIAVAGAAAFVRLGPSSVVAEARIALASVAPTPIRAPSAEARLAGERATPALVTEAGRLAVHDCRPISDTRGSAAYRRELVAVLTARAIAECLAHLGQPTEVA